VHDHRLSNSSRVTRAEQLKVNLFKFTDLLSSQTFFTDIEVTVRYENAFCEVTNLADYVDSTMSLFEPLLHLGNVAHASFRLSSNPQGIHRNSLGRTRKCQQCSALLSRFEVMIEPLFRMMKEMMEAHWTSDA